MLPSPESDPTGTASQAMLNMRALVATLVVLTALLALQSPRTRAQEQSGTSYITPFPESDMYRLQVYGDAFAEGVLSGLTEGFADDTRVQLQKRHRALPSVVRLEFDDELKVEEASRDTFHIAVVMIGYNDRNHMRTTVRDRVLLGSDEWRQEYGKRVDRLTKVLKKRGMAVYWVGQPIMRSPQANEPAQIMNDIVRERAYLNGIKYIDITAHFADEAGNYTPYGPDVAGKQRLVREVDGVLFTAAGFRKLAHFVEREIKRDLAQARSDRAIPLAGAEAEQKRIAAQRPRPDQDASWKSTVQATKEAKDGKAGQPKSASAVAPVQPPPAADLPGEQKADNGRISLKTIVAGGREETVTIELPRPPIPAAVIQLMTRKDTGDRPSQMGDVLADDVGGGLVVLSSVTPATTGGARRASPGQPYYQVWIKGERLPPRPGRADDFSWPRTDPDLMGDSDRSRRRPLAKTPPRS
jgi:uncharacterized protein